MQRALITARRGGGAGERGETLAELLVTIVIMGVAIVALIAGLADGILASEVHRQHATADTALRSAVETLKDRNLAWNAAGAYSVASQNGFSVALNASCWNGDAPPTFAACGPMRGGAIGPGASIGKPPTGGAVTPRAGPGTPEKY
jgi:type II secretory pathway pseudopilin PulG